MYAREHDLKLPFISPLYADLRGLPPLLLQVGTEETLLDDSTRLAERARVAGVDVALEVWKGMIHVFQLSAILVPEARRAIERIGEFMYQLGHPRL
jgi:acetyl esterase/lipase